MVNLKQLRPIQAKEIGEILADTMKLPSAHVYLFAKDGSSQNDGPTPKKQKTKLDNEKPISKREGGVAEFKIPEAEV